MSDFLIVGGGVIGLLLARELAADGGTVTILEKGYCCQEASWAGGGIVSPLYPWRYSAAVTALATQAQQAYPTLVAELLADTGIDAELEKTGLLMLEADDSQEAKGWAVETGKIMEAVDTEFIYQREHNLGLGFKHGLWMPEISNVRTPRLGKALLTSLRNSSRVKICEQTEVVELVRGEGGLGQHIVALMVRENGVEKRIPASQVVVTAGAWSGDLLAGLQISLPVVPVKGQMLLFEPPRRLLTSIVLTKGRYLIPRRDNHILIGSTLEHTGFDKRTTEEALQSLLASAVALVPELAESPVKQQWAGLRPGAPNGVPFIGKLGQLENLYINTGQYRNGLVLAPASAKLLADLLLGREPAIDPTPYRPAA